MTKEIQLTRGKIALVDDDEYDWLNQWKWHYNGRYATKHNPSYKTPEIVYMHRLIMNTPADMETDHINHDLLDNRRCNLRICTEGENQYNRLINKNNKSGKKGVCWYKRMNKWKVTISQYGKTINLGYYSDIEDAHKVYVNKSIELFGEFANGG